MADKNSSISRDKAVKRIASLEHLTEYLSVTNPGIWLILIAVILLMTGALPRARREQRERYGGIGEKRSGSRVRTEAAWEQKQRGNKSGVGTKAAWE